MLAKSGELKNEDEFPMPSDAIPEVIKSLVATFTAMRTATATDDDSKDGDNAGNNDNTNHQQQQ